MPVLREPLLHFLLLGAALFGWFAFLNPDQTEPESPDRIVIDDADIERLALRFETARQRPPAPQELTMLVDALIRQEVLVREAEALGMDIGDTVIRNRLSQKMEFLLESGARSEVPADDVLKAHLNDNSDRFKQPGWLAFEQVFLGTDPDDATVTATQTALNNGTDPLQLGQPSQLPAYMPPSRAPQINGIFGKGVFSAMDALPSDTWSGPVRSAFGLHFVRITDRAPATLPALSEVRDQVLADWTRDKAQDLSNRRFNELKTRYEIVLPEAFATDAGASE